VPYRASFPVEIPAGDFWWWVDIAVDTYFISDLLLSFRTAFVSDKGVRVGDPKLIAKNYVRFLPLIMPDRVLISAGVGLQLRGWFSIDFVSCIPVGHIANMMEDTDATAVDLASSMAGLLILPIHLLYKQL